MKTRVVVFAIAVLLCLGFNTFFALSVSPTVAANIAVGQLADDEIAAVAIRNYGHYSNMVDVLTWGAVVVLGICLFWGDVAAGMKKLASFIEETEGK